MSSLDYLDLCRLCLVKDRVSVPIFEGEGDVRQIFLKIAACLPVKVGREDKLPKKICDDCVYKVELFYQFWNTTANAEKQLLQWLGEVSMDDKQGYVTGAHDPSMMKPGQNTGENRLDGSSVMQQVNEHTNNMGMGMMDGMGIGMPMMIPNSGQQPQQQQMTSVPMDTGGNAVQNVQPVPGPSAQIGQQKINAPTNEDEDEDESEEEDNSDDECDGDDGLPVKEESEDEPNRTIEPTTFVNVSLACDEAGPSGLQQQKIGEMPEMVMPPTDGDPKSGVARLSYFNTKSPIEKNNHGSEVNPCRDKLGPTDEQQRQQQRESAILSPLTSVRTTTATEMVIDIAEEKPVKVEATMEGTNVSDRAEPAASQISMNRENPEKSNETCESTVLNLLKKEKIVAVSPVLKTIVDFFKQKQSGTKKQVFFRIEKMNDRASNRGINSTTNSKTSTTTLDQSFSDPDIRSNATPPDTNTINKNYSTANNITGNINLAEIARLKSGSQITGTINTLPMECLQSEKFIKLSKLSGPTLENIVSSASTENLEKIRKMPKLAVDYTHKKKFVGIRIISGKELEKVLHSNVSLPEKPREIEAPSRGFGDVARSSTILVGKFGGRRKSSNAQMQKEKVNMKRNNANDTVSALKLRDVVECLNEKPDTLDLIINQVATNSLPIDNVSTERPKKSQIFDKTMGSGRKQLEERASPKKSQIGHSSSSLSSTSRRSQRLLEIAKQKDYKGPVFKQLFVDLGSFNRDFLIRNNVQPFACPICHRKFKYRFGLQKHTREQHRCVTLQYDCEICDFSTKHYPRLREHFMEQHTNENKYECKECGKLFRLESDYTTHSKKHEEGSRPLNATEEPYPITNFLHDPRNYRGTIKTESFQNTLSNKRLRSGKSLGNQTKRWKQTHEQQLWCHVKEETQFRETLENSLA
ncbi:uncharacterized protein [Venturia canescens]|uniref:uncharacterized protein isoform X1 n=1 Tax=Venturia canescens TaxID=32260 RepID=UPI001C9CAC7F|nr:uncharacterized protein LOC122410056 isoform X1 [Venturia canescens]